MNTIFNNEFDYEIDAESEVSAIRKLYNSTQSDLNSFDKITKAGSVTEYCDKEENLVRLDIPADKSS